jgi:transcriptional pleiotropic regulator of transition state genes
MVKSTGIVRRVDELGRIVIPKETRDCFAISEKDALEIFIDEKNKLLVLKKYAPGCIFCGEMDDLKDYMEKAICKSCYAAAKKAN